MAAGAILIPLLAAWGLSVTARTAEIMLDKAEAMGMFKDFMVKFNRSYGSHEELDRRFQIFLQNMAEARRLQEEDLGTAQYGVTQFSDLTEEEFLGHPRLPQTPLPLQAYEPVNESLEAGNQKAWDWRKKGVIPIVRDQGQCSSCWAFAAVSNIESLWLIRGHWQEPQNLSVQELIDCHLCTGNDGCKGGWVWDAFLTVLNRRGLSSEEDYKYVGEKGKKCKARKGNAAAWIHDFAMLEKNEAKMAEYVASKGPITVTVNKRILQSYKNGIASPRRSDCDPQAVDHSVLLIGYGAEKHKPYWILQNSWGSEWGENGTFRLHRGSNACGITKYPVTAIVNPTQILGALSDNL